MEIENIKTTSVSEMFAIKDSKNFSINKEEPPIKIVFDAAYKGDDLTRRVSDILGIKDITGWSIIDTYEDLVLVHYTDNADMSQFGHIRGLLIDTITGDIIGNSFGYTPTAVTDEIINNNGCIEIIDTDGKYHKFNIDDAEIRYIFEGVLIRVIWWKNKAFFITHKKINPIRSKWGNSKYFLTIYEEAGGPKPEQLFDMTKPYSSTCYHFLVVDPSLLVGTRQRVSAPYIVFIDKQFIELTQKEEEIAPGLPTFTMVDDIKGSVKTSMIHNPKKLTIDSANHFLKYGYYKPFEAYDFRQQTGEAIIIYQKDKETGMVTDVLKVNSKSYEWRSNLRGGKPNVVFRFYELINIVHPNFEDTKSWDNFKEKFILFPLYSCEEMTKLFNRGNGILMIPPNPDADIGKNNYLQRDSRIHLLWMNYLLSLPLNLQNDALSILDNYQLDRKNLVSWLTTLEINNKDIDKTEYSVHIKRIINSARTFSRRQISNGNNYSKKGALLPLNVMIKKTITNLIRKEKGPSLYNMVRDMKKPPKPKDIKKEIDSKTESSSDNEKDESCNK